MKTFHFTANGNPDGHPDDNDVNTALAAMALVSKDLAGTDAQAVIIVASINDQDLERAIAANLAEARLIGALRQDKEQLLLLLTTVLKEHHGGRLRLTQSQLDAAAGHKFSAGAVAGTGYVQLTVESESGRLLIL